ncbi:MAG: alpha/beta hydrolase [Oscillospiraceae bacterium]
MIISVNGIKLFYEKKGEGTPIILVHGNSENHTIFDTLSNSLSKEHTVYLIDSRDHGQSCKVKNLYYVDMAEDIFEFSKALSLDKPAFLGFSDGGIVGLLFAIKYPSMLSHLIICGANTNPKGMKKKPLFFMKLGYFFSRNNKLKMMLTQPDIKNGDLNKIKTKTLVLAGSDDLILENHTKNIAENIKNSTLKILKKETHSSYVVNSNKLFDIVSCFIAPTF